MQFRNAVVLFQPRGPQDGRVDCDDVGSAVAVAGAGQVEVGLKEGRRVLKDIHILRVAGLHFGMFRIQ